MTGRPYRHRGVIQAGYIAPRVAGQQLRGGRLVRHLLGGLRGTARARRAFALVAWSLRTTTRPTLN